MTHREVQGQLRNLLAHCTDVYNSVSKSTGTVSNRAVHIHTPMSIFTPNATMSQEVQGELEALRDRCTAVFKSTYEYYGENANSIKDDVSFWREVGTFVDRLTAEQRKIYAVRSGRASVVSMVSKEEGGKAGQRMCHI